MPSQPDFEAAARLNPDKFQTDPKQRLNEVQRMVEYLADELAKAQKRTRAEVLADARVATASGKLPDRVEPKKEAESAKETGKETALFFAHKERSTYHPIALRKKVPYGNIKEENIRYFASAEEAEAAGFEVPKEEEKKDDKKDEKKEGDKK